MSVSPNQTHHLTFDNRCWNRVWKVCQFIRNGPRKIYIEGKGEGRENLTLVSFIFNSLGALIITLLLIKVFYVFNQKVDRQIKERNTNFLPFNYLYNTTPRAALPCLSPQTQRKTGKGDLTLYNSSLSNKMGDDGEKIHTLTHKCAQGFKAL